jgi:hypothetical protein
MEGSTPADSFARLDALIEGFKAYFPVLNRRVANSRDQEQFLVMRMMTEAASIKLHSPRASQGDLQSRSKALFAAHAISLLMENATRESINGHPMAGVSAATQASFVPFSSNPPV